MEMETQSQRNTKSCRHFWSPWRIFRCDKISNVTISNYQESDFFIFEAWISAFLKFAMSSRSYIETPQGEGRGNVAIYRLQCFLSSQLIHCGSVETEGPPRQSCAWKLRACLSEYPGVKVCQAKPSPHDQSFHDTAQLNINFTIDLPHSPAGRVFPAKEKGCPLHPQPSSIRNFSPLSTSLYLPFSLTCQRTFSHIPPPRRDFSSPSP